jgi:hypothetical protein
LAVQPKSKNQKKVESSPLPKNPVVQHPRNPLPPIPLAAKNPAGRKRRSDVETIALYASTPAAKRKWRASTRLKAKFFRKISCNADIR